MDICFLTETHLLPNQPFNVPPFVTINNPFSKSMKKPRGGVSCLISPDFKQYVKSIEKSADDEIVLILTGDHKIFSSYIPPADSIYFKSEMFSSVAKNFMHVADNRIILGGGDLNCRVGNLMKNVRRTLGEYRDNPDTEINSNGQLLIDICKSLHCQPLNNLSFNNKLFDGKFTFYGGNGKSQNDIIMQQFCIR